MSEKVNSTFDVLSAVNAFIRFQHGLSLLIVFFIGFWSFLSLSAAGNVGIQQHHGPGVLHEVCTRETLNISCSDNRRQVIVIRTARYGRMRLGRCVRKSYDYLGCAVDVRSYMDTRCSGRHGCSMRIPDDVMHEMQPCPPDLTPYLEVSYDCVDVQTADSSACSRRGIVSGIVVGNTGSSSSSHPPLSAGIVSSRRPVDQSGNVGAVSPTSAASVPGHTTGYLASVVSADDPLGLVGVAGCPWLITALPGQRINITLYNFVGSSSYGQSRHPVSGYGPSRADVCLEVAVILEFADPLFSQSSSGTEAAAAAGPIGRKSVMACGGDPRESHVYLSSSHRVQVEMINPKMVSSVGTYLLHYTAFGCPDVSYTSTANAVFASGGWVRREGDTTTIGCNATSEMWYLTCRNGRWIGDLANCTATSGVLMMIVLGVAVGIAVGALLLCLIAKITRRRSLCSSVQLEMTGTYQSESEYRSMFDFNGRHQHLFQQPSLSTPSQMETLPHPPQPLAAGQTVISTPPPSMTASPIHRHHFIDWNATVFDLGSDSGYASSGRRYGGFSPPVDVLPSPSTSRRCPNDVNAIQRGLLRDQKAALPTSTFKPGGGSCISGGGGRVIESGLRHNSLGSSFSNLI